MREIGQFDASLEFYKQANEVDAIRHKGRFRIASDLYIANELSDGGRQLESIIVGGSIPDDAQRCLWLANCVAIRAGHFDIADQLYKHAIKLEPALADDSGHQRQWQAIRASKVAATKRAAIKNFPQRNSPSVSWGFQSRRDFR